MLADCEQICIRMKKIVTKYGKTNQLHFIEYHRNSRAKIIYFEIETFPNSKKPKEL